MNNTPEKQIVIFSDTDGMHESKLKNAFEEEGFCTTRVSLMDCKIDSSQSPNGLIIPGMENELPRAAFVRAIPAGSFEEVTLRLDVLHALQECGVLVYNNARAIEKTVDKAMTSFLLHRAAIPAPFTWVCESESEAKEVVRQETGNGGQIVLKPLFGNCGRGLHLISELSDLPDKTEVNGVYYLQRFVPSMDNKGRDWRVFVIANQAVAAMERISDHWITNRARGGKCVAAVLTGEIRELAESAVRAINMNYAGVDIIRGRSGEYQVLEVNSVPAWRGLQSVSEKNITSLLAEDVSRICRESDKSSYPNRAS